MRDKTLSVLFSSFVDLFVHQVFRVLALQKFCLQILEVAASILFICTPLHDPEGLAVNQASFAGLRVVRYSCKLYGFNIYI